MFLLELSVAPGEDEDNTVSPRSRGVVFPKLQPWNGCLVVLPPQTTVFVKFSRHAVIHWGL